MSTCRLATFWSARPSGLGARSRSASLVDSRRSIEQTRPRPNPPGALGWSALSLSLATAAAAAATKPRPPEYHNYCWLVKPSAAAETRAPRELWARWRATAKRCHRQSGNAASSLFPKRCVRSLLYQNASGMKVCGNTGHTFQPPWNLNFIQIKQYTQQPLAYF